MQAVPRDAIERVARMYHSNSDASAALGIAMRSFGRLCRRYEVETPYERKRRRNREARREM
jgi:hypothetical protein